MESITSCDPCSNGSKSVPAIKYCLDCEEKLCQECADYHLRLKAFTAHHLIDSSSTDIRYQPPSTSLNCPLHPDFQLDLFCNQHDTVCCCACVPDAHRTCSDILPIQVLSKGIKTPSLLSDSVKEFDYMTRTINKLLANRKENRKLLGRAKQLISSQIMDTKAKVVFEIEKISNILISELNLIHEKTEKEFKQERSNLLKFAADLQHSKKQLEFLREHGSDKQLFIALRHQVQERQNMEEEIRKMISEMKEVNIKFDICDPLEIKPFGSIEEDRQHCNVKYKGAKSKMTQVRRVHGRTLNYLKRETIVALKPGLRQKNGCYTRRQTSL